MFLWYVTDYFIILGFVTYGCCHPWSTSKIKYKKHGGNQVFLFRIKLLPKSITDKTNWRYINRIDAYWLEESSLKNLDIYLE